IVSLRATLRKPLPRRNFGRASWEDEATATTATKVWSFTRHDWLEFPIYERAGLPAVLVGPAIVLEHGATTYLDAGYQARGHESGSLLIREARGDDGRR